jgi:hypothetical protein
MCLTFAGKPAYVIGMTKTEAVNLFGSVGALADALGVTRQAIYQWDEDLPDERRDRVVGAAVRLGLMHITAPEVEHNRRGKRQSAGTAEGVGAVTPGSGSNAVTATDAEDAA